MPPKQYCTGQRSVQIAVLNKRKLVTMNQRIRDILQPFADWFASEWNALFNAIVAKLEGQTA